MRGHLHRPLGNALNALVGRGRVPDADAEASLIDIVVTVGRCRLTVSNLELNARLVSALETKM